MLDLTSIKRPILTTKATYMLQNLGKYVFEVSVELTKPQIRFLIEKAFAVNVLSVNVSRRKLKRSKTTSRTVKFAVVTLAKGENSIY